ncbi:MAG: hypothetical protein CVV64_21520 [Candidatus Wallbacteria bacterium HGW-Wallbacteria-1]|uniref:Uncharacterized protein n=1 Tax=Candidatus Wallbacteria bacterium HGW-Wallbacteria-1 TaxID=2013854 RepID=A0A2N1PHH1_9BACT|nr:MAG: hypothetical protein CVV64_21520 [Candidatus Wallbacteria bacterium HGW-Wallbacteria-1]PKO54508.1 MAG: hypothetical protein CVU26_01820 [Betaproteobacteria bacterium HGW-Betaproteobacteria-2]
MVMFVLPAQAEPVAKVMVLDYQLNDMTDLPNAPEELERIAYLSSIYKQRLAEDGVELVPVNEALQHAVKNESPAYLFDNVPNAAKMAQGSGADYLLIGVALKSTYLFVYPRILLVDIRTADVVMARAAQLESSWSDENTTKRTAEKLADMVSEELKTLTAN